MEFCAIPIHESENAGKYILYRPMLPAAFVGNRAMVELVRAINRGEEPDQPEAVNFLREIGFLDPDPPLPDIADQAFHPVTAVLLMTNQCQLRCIYCYAAAGEQARQEMTFELARPVIDLVAENAQRLGKPNFSISFHGGGEPTRAWKVMKTCTEYARRKPVPADITLTSNGLWSKSQTEWILDNINGISLSIDGGPDTQNRQRPLASGKGSASLALRAAAALDRRSLSYGIRMTATAPWSTLPEDVRFLLDTTGAQSIQVEPAFTSGRTSHNQPGPSEADAFMEALLAAYDVAQQRNRVFYYAGARVGWATDTFCSAPYQAAIVRPDASLVACYEVTNPEHPMAEISSFGRVENGQVLFDEAARQRLHQMMAERRSGCRDCFCYWSCAGGCYTRAFLPGPTGYKEHGELCRVTRTLTEKLLLRNIAAGDGVWRSQFAEAR